MKLGPGLWTLICLGLLNRGVGPKTMVPTLSCLCFFPIVLVLNSIFLFLNFLYTAFDIVIPVELYSPVSLVRVMLVSLKFEIVRQTYKCPLFWKNDKVGVVTPQIRGVC